MHFLVFCMYWFETLHNNMIKRVVSVAISDIIICCHSNDNREEITNHVIHEIYIHIFGCFTFTFREKKHHNISIKIIINLPNIFLCYHSNNNSEKKQSCNTFNLHSYFKLFRITEVFYNKWRFKWKYKL